MADVLLSELISSARSRADMPVDGFISENEVTRWINEGVNLLHAKLVDAYGEDYAYKEQDITFVAGTEDYALPADFFRLWGIDLSYAGRTISLTPYTRAERNSFKNQPALVSYGFGRPRYSLLKNSAGARAVRILPSTLSGTGKLLYAPTPTLLVDGSDAVDLPDGWERYVAVYAAIQMLTKEESSTRELQSLLAQWDRELENLKATRDSAFPKSVVDMDRVELDDSWLF